MAYLYIAIGCAFGGIARNWCATAVAERVQSSFPWGTMAVNVVGSLLIGLVMGALDPGSSWHPPLATRNFINQFFVIGMLGGFTTFSSVSFQTLVLIREGSWVQAGANVLLSVVLCLIVVALGFWIAAR